MTKQPELLDAVPVASDMSESAQNAAIQAPLDPMLALFERFASNPTANVESLERLVALYERGQARAAEARFAEAMSMAQQEMKPVLEKGDNPQTRSKYATYEDLDRALRPIYTKHGFAPSFDTGEVSGADVVRVVCYVAHLGGHSRTYHVDMPADGKGAKGGDVMTKTHATGSALTYGRRYLLTLIFNIATTERDDDGNQAGSTPPDVPDGYEDWLTDMAAVADEGTAALEKAWMASKKELRAFVSKHQAFRWTTLKQRAAKVKA